MKNIGKLAVLGAVLAASASFAFADTIGSFATLAPSFGNINSSTVYNGFVAHSFGNGPAFVDPGFTSPSVGAPATTYTLAPVGVWSGPLPNSTYVGFASTAGPGGTNPAQGFYTFSTTFTTTQAESGLLSVYADDTTEVFLNGTAVGNLIMGFGSIAAGDTHCAATTPNCIKSGSATLNAVSGLNTLTFVVLQAGDETSGDPSGLDFGATLAPTPEPGSLMLLGTGLVSAAGMMFRRRATV